MENQRELTSVLYLSVCYSRKEAQTVGGPVRRMRDIIGLFDAGGVVNTSEFVLFDDVF